MADHVYAHAPMHCGHKGLFLDRLDAPAVEQDGTEVPRLVPFSDPCVHVRNRWYDPLFGRFGQGDPNETGLLVMEAMAYHGRGMGDVDAAFSMEALYGDGGNLYQYLGSNTWTRSDPLGLFVWAGDTLYLGYEVGRVAFNLVDQYATDLEAYSIWAEDWSLDDDLFEERRMREEWEAMGGAGGDPMLASIATIKGINAAIKAARFAGRVRAGAIYKSYHAAKYAIKQAGAPLQAHHIVEKRVLKALGMNTNGPAMALTRAQHQLVTNRLRNALSYRRPGGQPLGPGDKKGLLHGSLLPRWRGPSVSRSL